MKKLLFILTITFINCLYAIDSTGGHGGDGWLDSRGKPYLYDLKEGDRHLNPYFKDVYIDQDIKNRLMESITFLTTKSGNYLAQKLTEIKLIYPNFALAILAGIELYQWNLPWEIENIEDEDPIMDISADKQVQLAGRRDKNIYVSKKWWNKLNAKNSAALILHEIIFAWILPTIDNNESDRRPRVNTRRKFNRREYYSRRSKENRLNSFMLRQIKSKISKSDEFRTNGNYYFAQKSRNVRSIVNYLFSEKFSKRGLSAFKKFAEAENLTPFPVALLSRSKNFQQYVNYDYETFGGPYLINFTLKNRTVGSIEKNFKNFVELKEKWQPNSKVDDIKKAICTGFGHPVYTVIEVDSIELFAGPSWKFDFGRYDRLINGSFVEGTYLKTIVGTGKRMGSLREKFIVKPSHAHVYSCTRIVLNQISKLLGME